MEEFGVGLRIIIKKATELRKEWPSKTFKKNYPLRWVLLLLHNTIGIVTKKFFLQFLINGLVSKRKSIFKNAFYLEKNMA